MHLSKIKLVGFQSFANTGDIELKRGTNLIIGPNNAGKSALLRSLYGQLPNDPHRTPERFESHQLPTPTQQIVASLSGSELKDELRRRNRTLIPTPYGQLYPAIEYAEKIIHEGVDITIDRSPEGIMPGEYPSHKLFSSGAHAGAALVAGKNGDIAFAQSLINGDDLPSLAIEALDRKLFYFSAQRLSLGESVFQHATRLTPDASNLPAVLMTIRGSNVSVFDRLVYHLTDIFPTVGNMSVRPHSFGANLVEVLIWPTSQADNPLLAFPLSQSGTGVAQVIAILTAVMTVKEAVIVIDEINSFLHPAAVKNLLRILESEYSEHQYIVSTHSPEVVSFGNPATVHLVTREGYNSHVQSIDLGAIDQLKIMADHLGISMSDVFAAERVIWVEGQTEERCFPYVYEQLFGHVPRGTVFSRVAATGDFLSKRLDPTLIFNIYTRLSSATSSLVKAVVFSFDTEELTDREQEDLNRRALNRIIFLPRRMLECYLVDEEAISAFINARVETTSTTTAQEVAEALRQIAAQPPLLVGSWKGSISDPEWLAEVHGGRLIAEAVKSVSKGTVTFNKNKESLELLQTMAKRDRNLLIPLADYVRKLVDSVGV
ncbi:putative ATP-dependent endonuclease of OLD family [Sphingomonas sp. PP-F2F-G114-C0414]|uniref:ATP-dependent nuclease n=1 Tax=Sphingomonas sp. PP-F2F-G114-C0414 TaxID=2135662 RepID=UPI000EF89A91|nr:AAA family ATPase [Sphingomonas sp. PP-F2F-G114-C0414]RMB26234.1 putative ATP-dependent endonuclease of OLD family [Sphingomonas sp. PP-F2F-G114-C0414]